MGEVCARELGRGAFGMALLVERDGERQVLKKVSMANMNDQLKAYQLQEANLLRTLSHPNIVTYKGCEQRGETLHIYMEYCKGGDLLQVIRSRGSQHFPEDTVKKWLQQLASALKYIHGKRVLHRDLKPKNIFLSSDRSSLKIGDFGLAKVLSPSSDVANSFLGTLAYMAPEILLKRPYDTKADMYSLGACAFHMTALNYPERGQEVPNRYSAPLCRLIHALLSQRPEERPSAQAVLADAALVTCAAPALPSDQVTIILHGADGQMTPLKIRPATDTVGDVKVAFRAIRGIEPSVVSLTFTGRILKDHHTLAHYGVKHSSNVQVIMKHLGGGCEGLMIT